MVVKVASTGQVASGYRLTNISVFPPTVTVFSTNPSLVDRLPGFVETSPLDLTGVKDDIDIRLPLEPAQRGRSGWRPDMCWCRWG